ncbi:LOW QUALITY PROTEIN: reverse transcriptase [Phytophthora megakarya]|uniref:Reverse transcriptase n=1 Tax=Phytophthora megakarya TaxID=4795 RepID=A0A225UPI5_9STRA|nr:LOW QUALITY PROTEIN: reverse transcriptase [Phytophthora megakarya]
MSQHDGGKDVPCSNPTHDLGWLFRSKGLQGRLSQWAAILSPWRLEILRSVKGEEEILGALAASITSRAYVDAALEEIAPRKRPFRTAPIPVPKIGPAESLHVIIFDGSARVKREGGAFSAVIWKLPNWDVVRAASAYVEGLTVDEAEYRGMLLGISLLVDLDVARLIVCGDSNLVIRQMRGEMDCKSPGLRTGRQNAWCRPAIKMYIADINQRDWDQYAERLTYALNTVHDRTRDETPFFLVYGWDPRSTLEATLAVGKTSYRDAEVCRWRMLIQRHYPIPRAQSLELVREAVDARAARQNAHATEHAIERGSRVWLYLDRVKPGYARKPAHMWHGPFRVAELVSAYAVRLETHGTPYPGKSLN